MKKTISLLLSSTLLLTMAGCHQHTWAEATCTAPKTCTECGETEGEALPHTWAEATYQQPATCTVCGTTEGDPLPADFETRGFQLIEQGVTYPYTTLCYENPSVTTTAQATVIDYRVFDSDETHPAKDGYEWRTATFEVLFSDENAWNYGMSVGHCLEDYYTIQFHDDTAVQNGDYTTYTVNYYGEELPYDCYVSSEFSPWQDNRTRTFTLTCFVQVPRGYDGVVLGLRNRSIEWPEGGYIYDIYTPEDFLLFRMN